MAVAVEGAETERNREPDPAVAVVSSTDVTERESPPVVQVAEEGKTVSSPEEETNVVVSTETEADAAGNERPQVERMPTATLPVVVAETPAASEPVSPTLQAVTPSAAAPARTVPVDMSAATPIATTPVVAVVPAATATTVGAVTVLTGTETQDTTQPYLVDFRITPTNLPFDETTLQQDGQHCCITVTAQLMDDTSGISHGEFWFYVPDRPEKRHMIYVSEHNRRFGGPLDGTYTEIISGAPPLSDPGPWALLSIRLHDQAGNEAYWTGDDLAALEIPMTYTLGMSNVFIPVIEHSDEPSLVTVNTNANLREGPGTNTRIAGTARRGSQLELTARNEDGTWYQLADGRWIAAFLVNGAPADLPVAP